MDDINQGSVTSPAGQLDIDDFVDSMSQSGVSAQPSRPRNASGRFTAYLSDTERTENAERQAISAQLLKANAIKESQARQSALVSTISRIAPKKSGRTVNERAASGEFGPTTQSSSGGGPVPPTPDIVSHAGDDEDPYQSTTRLNLAEQSVAESAIREQIDDQTYADFAKSGKRINPRELAAYRRMRYAQEDASPPGGGGSGGASSGGGGSDDKDGDKKGDKKGGASFGNAIAMFRIIRGFEMAATTGNAFGRAVGDIARGLTAAVTGSASGFAAVGSAILNAIFSPWGQSGAAISKGVEGLANGMIKAVSAGGKFVAAGIQAATAFHVGMMALGGTALGAVAGGVIGGIVGGGGGAIAGAGLGAMAVGYVAQIAGQIVSTIGGAIGQMLSAVGSAVGELGNAIASVIGNVISAVRDLVTSAQAFAQTTYEIQRGTGTSMQNSGMIASLSQIATGSPSSFNSMFSGYGMFGVEQRQRAMSMGIDVSGNDFGQYVQAAQKKYRTFGNDEYGSMMKQNLLNVMFPGQSGAFGNLLSLQPQQLQGVLAQAKANAPTAQEDQQDLSVGMQLNQIDAMLERMKRKFLVDVLPAISKGFDVIAQYFSTHSGQITKGFESIGQWLFVKFPSMLDKAATSLLSFASTFAKMWPQIVSVVLESLRMAMAFVIALARQLTPIANSPIGKKLLGNDAGAILGKVGALNLHDFGLSNFQTMGLMGASAKESAQWMKDISGAQKSKDAWFNSMGLSASQEKSRASQLAGLSAGTSGGGSADNTVKADLTLHIDPNDFRTAVTNATAKQGVLAFQVANT